jgi:hypothetical protein
MIQHQAIYYQHSYLLPPPKPEIRNAPSIPGLEAKGFTARFDKSGALLAPLSLIQTPT